MVKIKLPFQNHFERQMLDGIKTCTSRPKRYGEIGDTFEAFGATFEITKQERWMLEDVACGLYLEEGCDAPARFIVVWKSIHRKAGWRPEQIVWVHWFVRQINLLDLKTAAAKSGKLVDIILDPSGGQRILANWWVYSYGQGGWKWAERQFLVEDHDSIHAAKHAALNWLEAEAKGKQEGRKV